MTDNTNKMDWRGITLQVAGVEIAGTSLTLTGAEIAVLDDVVAGTTSASKALVVGSNKNLDTLVIADGGLKLGSGAGTAVGATALEINNAADTSANTEIVTTTNVIAATESGMTYFLNSATEFVSTLPAVAQGLKFTFIVTVAPSGASYTIVTNASANIIKSLQNSVAGDQGDFGTSDDTITFVDGQAVAGDRVDVICDGTSWFAYARSKVAAGITFTTAS